MPNYNYVIDSSFQPFSMQEMLIPLTAYKEEYDKVEEKYIDLSEKADKFKYLSNTLPEGSDARKIYEGYANELSKQAEDLSRNGLSMKNRRALTSLRRRYSGEIGMLDAAKAALDEEMKLRRTMNAQDPSRLYATDNLNIDNYLYGKNPNLYNISGTELYTRGTAAGKAASSRQFKVGDEGATLGGYYRDYVQINGYSPESIAKFRKDASAIPELQMAADAILEERGVNQNLTGINLQRARQSVINGIIDGVIYNEQHSPQRDLGKMTASEATADSRAREALAFEKEKYKDNLTMSGLIKNSDGTFTYDPNKSIKVKIAEAQANAKNTGKTRNGNGRTSSTTNSKLHDSIKLTWSNNPTESDDNAKNYTYSVIKENDKHEGTAYTYDELDAKIKPIVKKYIGQDDKDHYVIHYKPHTGSYGTASLEIIPKDPYTSKQEETDFSSLFGETPKY